MDKLEAIRQLLNSFSPDDRDKILEILRLALELIHPAAPV